MYQFASHNDVYEKNESKTICWTHLKFLEQHMKDFFEVYISQEEWFNAIFLHFLYTSHIENWIFGF